MFGIKPVRLPGGAAHGRASQTAPAVAALADSWRIAADLNARFGTDHGEYVPWAAIQIRDDILPRERLNGDAVRQYADVFDALPPILVQKDTFVLLDGKHRLFAAADAFRDHVRIRELDIPDAELAEQALVENITHGVPLTSGERLAGAQRLLNAHPDWSDARIAERAGVHRQRVWALRQKAAERERRAAERAAERTAQGVRTGHPVAQSSRGPVTRLGRDDKVYTVPEPAVRTSRSNDQRTSTVVPAPVPDHAPHAIEPATRPAGFVAPAAPPVAEEPWLDAMLNLVQHDPSEAARQTAVTDIPARRVLAQQAREWLVRYLRVLDRGDL